MAEILDMLARGNAEYSMERKVLPLELIADLTSFNSLPSPRVLQTHLPYKWFPRIHVENKGKIIHCIRNPKDMYVSMFHHCSTGLELGRKTEGMTWTQFFDNCIMEKVCLHGTWFDYVKQMDQAKKDGQNIYTVHYEKMRENLYQGIKAIARFLELHYSDDLLKDIIQKCSFSNLKRAYDDIKELSSEVQTSNKHYVEMFPDYQLPNIFRKGIVGDWKNHFTVAQNEQFDALYEKGMKDCDIEVL
ncbi:hypothetical protein FSP39_002622 [Pinctada imbricata]|uniref:Sulfotransferase domain-containing protein n=1 Tax=Pinctada imbricata TaxID=66713 RepID=A0AA89BVB0_PINIB|nr:hypothetical protein FSP39_002622 [Pinctada imbricata]